MENDTVPSIREPSSHQGSITANAGDRRDMGLITGLGRSPGGGNSTPVLLPGESQGKGSLVGYSPWGHKELDTTEAT